MSKFITSYNPMTSSGHAHFQTSIGNISGTKHPIDLKTGRHVKGTYVNHVTQADDVVRLRPLSVRSLTFYQVLNLRPKRLMRPKRVIHQTTPRYDLFGFRAPQIAFCPHLPRRIPTFGPRHVFKMGIMRKRHIQTRQAIFVNRDSRDASRRDLSECIGLSFKAPPKQPYFAELLGY